MESVVRTFATIATPNVFFVIFILRTLLCGDPHGMSYEYRKHRLGGRDFDFIHFIGSLHLSEIPDSIKIPCPMG